MRAGVAVLACCLLATGVAAQQRLTGDWSGWWMRAGDSLPVTLHVTRDSTSRSYTAAFDSERLRVTGIPFDEVTVRGCCDVTMRLRGDRTTAVFTGTLRGTSLSGELRDEDGAGRFAYTRVRSGPPALVEREVTFRNGDVRLAGSLLLPSGRGPHPAVLFLHGSGAEGRWASRFLATAFAHAGVGALIYDKRGVGRSAGDWRSATIDDLAADAAAAIAQLQREARIDGRRVGVHGHSQGGTLAPLIAVRTPGVAFVIASAAAGVPTDSTEIFSILNAVYPNATTAADSARARAYVGELVAVAYGGKPRHRLDSLVSESRGQPWFFAPPAPDASYWSFSRSFAAYRPLDWWRQVRAPVLLLYGAEDERVPVAESAARIAGELLRHSPAADVTVRILPEADHTFRLSPGPSGWPRTAPQYLPALLDWVRARAQVATH